MSHTLKIKNIKSVTHNVKEYTLEKPVDFEFRPGEATEVSINKPKWKEQKRPFTFTSLPEDEFLQFVIKSYHDHDGVTHQLYNLMEGDELIIDDPWGAIEYKGEGTFIAGGAGITPFISILKQLEKDGDLENNSLIFSNKYGNDVIFESYFQDVLEDNFISTLTNQKVEGHDNERITLDFLNKHINNFTQQFYICGPESMVTDIAKYLEVLGAEPSSIVFEK